MNLIFDLLWYNILLLYTFGGMIMFQLERRKLKNLCLDIIYTKKSSNYSLSNEDYNMTVLSLMAICILGNVQKKKPIEINSSNDFAKNYFKEINILNRSFPFMLNYIKMIEFIPNDVIKKTHKHISNEKRSSLDNVLSWAYQYLKTNIKEEAYTLSLSNGKKIDGLMIAPATQFFTEDYMVKHLTDNSLKNIDISESNIKEFKIFDPACGGGNFLIYALEKLFNQLSPKFDSKEKLIKLLIEKVLVGYDIDYNLSKIASLNLYLKAQTLCELNEELFYSSIYTTTKDKTDIIGALRKNGEKHFSYININTNEVVPHNKLFKENSYSIVLTNPPFMGKRDMGSELLDYLNKNYPMAKGDLCIAFMERSIELTRINGRLGIVNQNGWMFLSSYSDLRLHFLKKNQFTEIVDLGSKSFLDINGEKTSVSLTNINKEKPINPIKFIKLNNVPLKTKEEILSSKLIPSSLTFHHKQQVFLENADNVIQYGISMEINNMFNNYPSYGKFATPMQGTSTGNNKEFVDFSWNRQNDPDWIPVSKGGGFCKWAGLNIYKVKWGRNAELIKNNPGSAIRNLKYIEETELVYSDTGTRGLSVRILNKGQVFIASGPGIRINEGYKFAHLAFLNSRLATYFLRVLNPKYTIAAGYIKKIPMVSNVLNSKKIATLGEKTYKLKSKHLTTKITNAEYIQPDFSNVQQGNLGDYLNSIVIQDLDRELLILELENKMERYLQREYCLNESDVGIIESEVGVPAFKNTNKKLEISATQLEDEISKLLNESCQFVSNTKTNYGTQGILEELSFSLDVNPYTIYTYIKDNIDLFKDVKQKYTEDLMHKAVLSLFNFKSQSIDFAEFSLEELTVNMIKMLPSLEETYIEKWLLNRFLTVHIKTFYNNPVLEMIDTSSGVLVRSLCNRTTE